MDRETAWTIFIAGFTGTAQARRLGRRFQAGPIEGVRFAGDEERPREPFDEFFVRACDPALALVAVTNARPVAKHYVTVLDDQPGLVAAYERGGYRLSHSEDLMACDLGSYVGGDDGQPVMLARTKAEVEWLNANDPQGMHWIPADNAADPHMAHYAMIVDDLPVARGRNLHLDEAHGYVSRVYTATAYRRRGLARILMRRLRADDAARGARWSVLTASAMGAGLYAELGYQTLGRIHILEPTAVA